MAASNIAYNIIWQQFNIIDEVDIEDDIKGEIR